MEHEQYGNFERRIFYQNKSYSLNKGIGISTNAIGWKGEMNGKFNSFVIHENFFVDKII